jgi:hypothetical protein
LSIWLSLVAVAEAVVMVLVVVLEDFVPVLDYR